MNDNCDEIHKYLYHHMLNGKFVCNREISGIFKKKGYKWKQLINDAKTKRRSTVFFVQRDKEKYGSVRGNVEVCMEPIKFVSSGIFSDFESNESVWITKSARDF